MSRVFYDLHLHSCLSPCGDNDMTPNNIVNMALLSELDMIALTDHNTCKNCRAAVEIGRREGLCVVPGMELTTSEEIHVVCLFPTADAAEAFSDYVAAHSPPIKNKPQIFGDQLILNESDEIIGREERLLITASDIPVGRAAALARSFGGAAFPAHIDRSSYSVLSVLGAFPQDAGFFAAEITARGDLKTLKAQNPALGSLILLRDSDAHYLENMGWRQPNITLPDCSAQSLIAALRGEFPAAFQWG